MVPDISIYRYVMLPAAVYIVTMEKIHKEKDVLQCTHFLNTKNVNILTTPIVIFLS